MPLAPQGLSLYTRDGVTSPGLNMNAHRSIGVALACVLSCLLASGCATSPTGVAADVVPISVNVTPILTDPLKPLLQIETTMSSSGVTDCVLLFFYDIRDETATDPDLHLDADDFLELNADARARRFSITGDKYTMFVNVKGLRTVATTVNVVAIRESVKKGAFGAGKLPAASSY